MANKTQVIPVRFDSVILADAERLATKLRTAVEKLRRHAIESPNSADKAHALYQARCRLIEKRSKEVDRNLTIVEQALVLFEHFYVNRPLKESLHAVEPIRRLQLLKNELSRSKRRLEDIAKRVQAEDPGDDDPTGDDDPVVLVDGLAELVGFHFRIGAIFGSVHDRHVSYAISLSKLLEPNSNEAKAWNAFLGFEVEAFFEDQSRPGALTRRYMLSHMEPRIAKARPGACEGVEFKPGVEILSWNGVPIARAVEVSAVREPGSNHAARHARGLKRLTLRPLEQSIPPAEDSVVVTYKDPDCYLDKNPLQSGKIGEICFDWQLIRFDPKLGGHRLLSNSNEELPNSNEEHAAGFDLEFDAIRGLRKKLFAPDVGDDDPQAEAAERDAIRRQRQQLSTRGVVENAPQVQSAVGGDDASAGDGDAVPPSPGPLGIGDPRGKPIRSLMPKLLRASLVPSEPDGRHFGYLRIFSFRPGEGGEAGQSEFVEEVRFLLEEMARRAPDGLIIDVRDNPGGAIPAGERLLQLLTPRPIEPVRFEFLATPPVLELVRRNPIWSKWLESLEEAQDTGAMYSRGFPITDPDVCNQIGQRYYGPVVLITSALSYSTTDIFAAGFQDHGIGKILGVDETTGAGGANVITHAELKRKADARVPTPEGEALGYLPQPEALDELALEGLPDGIGMWVAFRRALRAADRSGALLEDLGAVSDCVHRMTRDDLLEHNRDLLEAAKTLLRKMPRRELELAAVEPREGARDDDKLQIEVRVGSKHEGEELTRVDCYVNDRPQRSREVPPKTIRWVVPTRGTLRIEAFARQRGSSAADSTAKEVLVAARLEDLKKLAGS